MDIMDFIIGKALVLIPALYIVGVAIKKIPKAPDWIIPFVLFFFGILGAVGLMGFSADAVIQGVLVAGTAVYANQLIKQGVEGLTFKPPDEGQ